MRHFDKRITTLKLIHKIENLKRFYLRCRYIYLLDKKDSIREDTSRIWAFVLKTLWVAIVVGTLATIIYHIDCSECSEKSIQYYIEVLIGIAAIETLFIGLYYAGMSSVASSAYANVPHRIKSLLIDDGFSRVFMGIASYASVFSYVFIALHLFAGFTSSYALCLSLLGCILVISNFIYLGKRLFHLLDPKIWTSVINRQLFNNWKSVSTLFIKDPSLELVKSCHSKAENWIQCYESLGDLLIDETRNSQGDVLSLCGNILAVLTEYQKAKRTFPTTCPWYEKRYVYNSITQLDFDCSNLFVNLKTQRPGETVDLFWFETRLEKILLKGFRQLAKNKSRTGYLWIVAIALDYVTSLAENGDVKRAQVFIDELWNSRPEAFEERKYAVSFVENIFRLEINLMLVLSKEDDYNKLTSKINSLDLNDKKGIYGGKFNLSQISVLEHILSQVNLEKGIQKKIITPKWYVVDYLAQHDALKFDEILSLVSIENVKRFEKRVNDFVNDAFVKSVVLKCIEEYWERFNFLQEKNGETLALLKTNVKNPFPLFERKKWTNFLEHLKKHKKFIADQEASILPKISIESRDESFPDYMGTLRYDLGDQCFKAALKNDFLDLEKWFTIYLTATFEQAAMANSGTEQKTIFDSAIIISSGLIICSEFYGADKRAFIEREWQKILGVWLEHKGASLFFNNILSLPLNTNTSYLQKFNQLVESLLQSVEYETANDDKSFIGREKIIAKHSSPIIRVLVKEMKSSRFHEFKDYCLTFISSSLMDFDALQDLNFDHRCRFLKQAFDEENYGCAKR